MLDAPVDRLDLSARATHVLTDLQVSTIRQLLNYDKTVFAEFKNIGRKTIAEIEAKLLEYLAGRPNTNMEQAGEIQQTGMSSNPANIKELVDQMLVFLPDRDRNIMADRYGLWDGIAETLQDIGDKLGLTRERIRQIEVMAWKRILRRSKHGIIKHFISSKIRFEFETNPKRWGVIGEAEAIVALAVRCTVEEVEVAIDFLQDIDSPGENLFASSLIEAESGVYCADGSILNKYQEMLHLVDLSLRAREKPLTEMYLIKEVSSQGGGTLSAEQLGLAHRILTISPKVSRLRNGTIALSEWVDYRKRDVASLSEAALRLLGRPTHFREVAKKVNSLLQEQEAYSEGYIHNALLTREDKFVWVKNGTYGLVKWGLKKPPYVKDRIIELLSAADYPLPLWHLEEKVLEVCNCKRASIRMTLDLNPKLFRRFDGEQYGLRENSAK
jgi:hypothetical protein